MLDPQVAFSIRDPHSTQTYTRIVRYPNLSQNNICPCLMPIASTTRRTSAPMYTMFVGWGVSYHERYAAYIYMTKVAFIDPWGLAGLTRVLERCIERKNSRSYAQPHVPPCHRGRYFSTTLLQFEFKSEHPKKLFRWVRSHQVDLGQTWNGVKTRKSRRVMLILVFYVHVLRHLKKDFLNFSFFFKTAKS